MLIRFTVKNFLSFNKETEFNMLTASNIRRLPHHKYKHKNIDVLRSAVIYGANGAGKSNLIKGISFLREIVIQGSIIDFTSGYKHKYNLSEKEPCFLEVEFVVGRKTFAYGLSFNEGVIVEEWLYELGLGNTPDDPIFIRKLGKNGKSKIKLHPKYLQNEKNVVLIEVYEEDLLERHMPFLFLAKNQKFKEISDSFEWFKLLFILGPDSRNNAVAEALDLSPEIKDFVNESIREFQIGISRFDLKIIDFDLFFGEDNLYEKENVLRQVREGNTVSLDELGSTIALMDSGRAIIKKVIVYHKTNDKEEIEFELSEESDGTQRLLDFIPLMLFIITARINIIIDEIDRSLHPALLKVFIKRFQESKKTKGQLIFTTHESNLLDLELFRQDEIWFAEKDKSGATQLYPLSDYDVRSDLDIRKGYLSGRFGAIPFLGNLKDLNWDIYAAKSK